MDLWGDTPAPPSQPPSLSCLLLISKELHLVHKIKTKVAVAHQQLHFHFSHPANFFKNYPANRAVGANLFLTEVTKRASGFLSYSAHHRADRLPTGHGLLQLRARGQPFRVASPQCFHTVDVHSPGSDLMASVLYTTHCSASRARHCCHLMGGGNGTQLALSKAGNILDTARA